MKSVKKEMILVIGLLSVFATASLISLCTSCNKEPEIEYRDKVVEVEKPVEVIKEVEVVKEIEVEKKVEVPVEVIREVKIGVPFEVEKIVEKEVYVEKSQVDLNGIDVVKLDDNLYEFEFTAAECHTEKLLQVKKMFDLNGIYISDDFTSQIKVFHRGELVSKPGYIIKDILFANPDKMAAPTVLDNDYNKILPASSNSYAIKYEYSNLNKEQIHISFNKCSDCYSAKVLRIVFAINNETYIRPEADQIIYGYAGLQINNGDCIYKRGYIGETVTSEELENFVLSLYPNCKIVAKEYSKFTTTYSADKFTTRKIWIEKE